MRTPTFVRLLPILILLATLSGSPAAVRGQDDSTDSAMFLADPAHSGAWPGPGPTGKVSIRWQTVLAVPDPQSNAETTSSVVAGGSVYVAVAHDVVALDATTGAIRWRFTTQDGTENSTPAVAGGVVFAGSFDGNVYALDAATGQELWRTEIGPVYVDLTVAGGTLYAGSGNDLYALDTATGSVRWHAEASWHFDGAPAVAAGAVYVCTEDGTLFAFDVATGAERWHLQIGQLVFAAPVVAAGGVYAIDAFGGLLYALDAVTGQERWHFEGGNHLVNSSPLVVADTVYLINGDGNLFAIDAATGTERWRTLVPTNATAPVIAGGVIYYLGGISLYAVDLASRKLIVSIFLPQKMSAGVILTSPAVAGGMVYAATRDGIAVAFAGDGAS